jgi:zinc protease
VILRAAIVFSLFFSFLPLSGASIKPVVKYKLDNGLTVLLHRDAKLPLYSFHLWYKVGSSDEDPNRTGLAHFFEHLMFKGTKNYGQGYFDSYIEDNGGSNNAFTSRDVTAYYENMPAKTLQTILKLEADRMVNLEVSLKNVKQEREVVKEERRLRVENSPMGLAYEALFENSFTQDTPYHWPVLGSMKHLEQSTLEDFQKFYKKYYAPNNAVLVVSGDFSVSKVKKWIQEYFGPLKSSDIKKTKFKSKYKKRQYKKINKTMNSKVLMYSFPGTSVGASDEMTLDLIATILSDGENSYLYQELVEKNKSFLSVGVSSYSLAKGGLHMASASLKPGESTTKANKAFKKALQEKLKQGFTKQELDRGVKLSKINHYEQFKTLSSKAYHLAMAETYHGDYSYHFNDIKKLEAIGLEDVNKIFRQYYKINDFNFIEVGK